MLKQASRLLALLGSALLGAYPPSNLQTDVMLILNQLDFKERIRNIGYDHKVSAQCGSSGFPHDDCCIHP